MNIHLPMWEIHCDEKENISVKERIFDKFGLSSLQKQSEQGMKYFQFI